MKILYFSILSIILLVLSGQVYATEEQLIFTDANQKELYSELIKELRCPKCQNQNIADSNAVVAKDMRAKTKQLVEQGQGKQDVIDYMVNRYGQFAHYQPPLNIATSLLWLLPITFIVLAVLVLVKRSRTKVSAEDEVLANNRLQQESKERLDQELEVLLSSKSSTQSNDSMSVENEILEPTDGSDRHNSNNEGIK